MSLLGRIFHSIERPTSGEACQVRRGENCFVSGPLAAFEQAKLRLPRVGVLSIGNVLLIVT
jgi:hypothetical protein